MYSVKDIVHSNIINILRHEALFIQIDIWRCVMETRHLLYVIRLIYFHRENNPNYE